MRARFGSRDKCSCLTVQHLIGLTFHHRDILSYLVRVSSPVVQTVDENALLPLSIRVVIMIEDAWLDGIMHMAATISHDSGEPTATRRQNGTRMAEFVVVVPSGYTNTENMYIAHL